MPDPTSRACARERSAQGDVYVVNGQKVWSSRAAFADRCLLLARTDPDAPKRRGISYFLLDMKSPGVEARTIRQATGAAEFCEIFLTDVEIPVTDLVGEENDGWKIAQSTLSAERGLAQLELSERMAAAMSMVEALVRERRIDGRSAIEDDSVREQFVTLQTEVILFRRLCKKMVEDLVRRGGTGPESSIVKVFYSELLQRMMAFGVSLAGLDTHRLTFKPVSAGYESGRWMLDYIDSFGWVIAGGTNEIQRSLIGETSFGSAARAGAIVSISIHDEEAFPMSVVDTSQQELREELRTAAREMLRANSASAQVRALAETASGFDDALWRQFAMLGWPGIEVSEDLGGAGGRFGDLAVILIELGRRLCSNGLMATAALGCGSAARCRAGKRRRAVAAPTARRRRPCDRGCQWHRIRSPPGRARR